MPESDISKMKVVQLKCELKLRGLPTTGNKTELQERLQNALLEANLSLEDTARSGEDLVEDVLTDEEEKVALTLPPDENELPTSELNREIPTDQPNEVAEKISLKRKSSTSPIPTETTIPTTAEKTEVTDAPENETDSQSNDAKIIKLDDKPKQVIKVSTLTLEERMQMRAKKFGLDENKITAPKAITVSKRSAGLKEVDPKQIETLKKRAERFGCVVSSTIAKITADERLEKRKQRFGDFLVDSGKATPAVGKGIYAEKARQRLQRFKMATK